MSLASALRPVSLTFGAGTQRDSTSTEPHLTRPFQHEASYLNLHRTLIRFQHLILLTPSPKAENITELSPLQRQVQGELWSPLPYHRNKWLHNVDGARTLLLQLERKAQGIRVQRARLGAIKLLAEERASIKKLKNRIEEIGREVEIMGSEDGQSPVDDGEGETLFDILQQQSRDRNMTLAKPAQDDTWQQGRPLTQVEQQSGAEDAAETEKNEKLFASSSTVRRRGKNQLDVSKSGGQTTGFSNMPSPERALLDSSRVQEDITTSLVSMAVQLKQQGKAMQFSMEQDKGILGRAIQGLDINLSGMEAASKNMAFLRRMSEEEGLFGRLKLYAMIFGMWIVAFLLVFVCPKLRF